MLHERKYTRLDLLSYRQLYTPCSITIAIKERKELFGLKHDMFTKAAIDVVRKAAVGSNQTPVVPIHIVLFMPDHVHLCIESATTKSIIQFVQEIKSRIAVEAAHLGYPASFWQRSFFDHFLRKEENIGTVIRYILNNPPRKNIVQCWWEYPYWYSNQYTLEQLKNME